MWVFKRKLSVWELSSILSWLEQPQPTFSIKKNALG